MHKSGQHQDGLNIAVLVAMLALFILGYIILLPPDERDNLLDGSTNGNNGNGNNKGDSNFLGDVLLSETPGIVRPFADESVKHKLAPVDLFIRDKPETSSVAPRLLIERNVFSDRKQSIHFTIEDFEVLQSVDLFFTVRDPRGRLELKLNGREIFNGQIDNGKLESINLPIGMLGNTNTITFSTSFSLFGSNHYTLEDVKLRKGFDLRNIDASRTFVLDKNEYDRITDARLNYFISCISPGKETTELRILLNDRAFERLNIPCVGDEVTFDIDKDDLREGRNTFSFSIDAGDFRFTDIEVEIELDEKVFPTFNFVVDDDEFKDVMDDDVDAVLKMNFLDDRKRKEGQLFLNGNRLFIDTTSDVYIKDISSFLEEGSNELKIVPTSQFEILNLEIRFE